MKNVALEWGRFGIRAKSVVPGPIKATEEVEASLPCGAKGAVDRLNSVEPHGHRRRHWPSGSVSCFAVGRLHPGMRGCLRWWGQNLRGSVWFDQSLNHCMELVAKGFAIRVGIHREAHRTDSPGDSRQ
jgi:hypothetical protein